MLHDVVIEGLLLVFAEFEHVMDYSYSYVAVIVDCFEWFQVKKVVEVV